MKTSTHSLLLLGSVVALAMTGCSGGGDAPTPGYSPTQPKSESFTSWSKSAVFTKPAESTPEVMDTLVFSFDGNDDPNAYTELLPPAM